MFGFLFSKKKVDADKVQAFKDALESINIFILISEWERAKDSILEIEHKERIGLNSFLSKYRKDDSEKLRKIKSKLIEENKKRFEQLEKLKEKVRQKEEQYNKKVQKERFKVRFRNIHNEIVHLTWKNKNWEALRLLQAFLEENTSKPDIIDFYNKQKKIILKNIEKEKARKEVLIEKNTRTEALTLIWQTIQENNISQSSEKKNFFGRLQEKFGFYKKLQESIKNKQLLDEINILIEENTKVKNDLAEKKLANIHKWLIKEISHSKMQGYDLYGKILWADKISWDAFGIYESKNRYHFFLWDATGHGIKAWFIVTLLSRLFNKHVKSNNLQNLAYEINNGLKQDLQSRNFITWVFFEVNKEALNIVDFVWMWHEPMLVYREKEEKVEKIIPGWLAAWIRMIKNKEDIKAKAITMQNNDILMIYSDGIVENKNPEWEYYWIDRLQKVFHKIAAYDKDINRIYEFIMNDVQLFRWGSSFLDDASILILKRNQNKDIQDHGSQYLVDVSMREGLKKGDVKKLEWKTKEEIRLEIENIKKEKETKRIIKSLENLYYTWEVLKLKQEAIRFIREWFIHKKINFYLKKALVNEKKYKIEQKNIKLKNKYNVLEQLEKKGDYDTVIKEIEDVITKDGNL